MRGNLESDHQRAVFQWSSVRASVDPYLFAIPNGGSRDAREAARMKGEGVKPGMPDICFARARGGYFGLFIEMKRPADPIAGRSPGTLTSVQRHRISTLRAEGYRCEVCFTWNQAVKLINEYMASGQTIGEVT